MTELLWKVFPKAMEKPNTYRLGDKELWDVCLDEELSFLAFNRKDFKPHLWGEEPFLMALILSPCDYHYYLPSFLESIISAEDEENDSPILRTLDLVVSDECARRDITRYGLFSEAECIVIREVLQYLEEVRPSREPREDYLRAKTGYWGPRTIGLAIDILDNAVAGKATVSRPGFRDFLKANRSTLFRVGDALMGIPDQDLHKKYRDFLEAMEWISRCNHKHHLAWLVDQLTLPDPIPICNGPSRSHERLLTPYALFACLNWREALTLAWLLNSIDEFPGNEELKPKAEIAYRSYWKRRCAGLDVKWLLKTEDS